MAQRHELDFDWIHLAHDESAAFTETYGFAGNQGVINVEGILIRPRSVQSRTLHLMMHPASTLQLLPVPRAMAHAGAHVLCAGSRYAKNDTACTMEKVILDLGAFVAHARNVMGYERVVLVGWSGGGSLALFYQSQAEHPTITHTPSGDPVNITRAGLIPADAVIFQAAHISRAQVLADWIDPSVRNELNPDDRNPALDIYAADNPEKPPYSPGFVTHYRAEQLARIRRITAWVKEELARLKGRNSPEVERGFITHRTMADPRFLDPALEPNGRRPNWCYLGNPETVNTGPVGLARFSTLRSWLSQWSIDDTNADGLRCATRVTVPFLAIESCADDAVPQPHTHAVFDAAASRDKHFAQIEGATHYYAGQPEKIEEVTLLSLGWLRDHGLGA